MTTCVALIRGINVGKAKRVAMADLRALVEELGHARVRTLLNSGNVVFDARVADTSRLARAITAALQARTQVSAQVVVITGEDLARVIDENPLPQAAADPSRFLVAFVGGAADLGRLATLGGEPWEPDRLAVGVRAAYLWCGGPIHESRLALAVMKRVGEGATTRNWSTVLKLRDMATD